MLYFNAGLEARPYAWGIIYLNAQKSPFVQGGDG
jgi:hypothetical protein